MNIRLVYLSFLRQQAVTHSATDHYLTLRSQLVFLATPWHRALPNLHPVSSHHSSLADYSYITIVER